MIGSTIPGLLRSVRDERPAEVAFRFKREGAWRHVTWTEAEATSLEVARALMAIGVGHGARVAILSQSRLEWVLADFGIVGCGAVTVKIYPTNLAPDCGYVLEHSEACVSFVEDAAQLAKLTAVRAGLPALRTIVVFDGSGSAADGVLAWSELLSRAGEISLAELERRSAAITPQDLATIVYTSGTSR